VAVHDVASGARLDTISTGDCDRPHGVATHAAGWLAVTSESTQNLLLFDLESFELRHAVDVGAEIPHICGIAPDGGTAYAANIGSSSLTPIDMASGRVLGQIPVMGCRPGSLRCRPAS